MYKTIQNNRKKHILSKVEMNKTIVFLQVNTPNTNNGNIILRNVLKYLKSRQKIVLLI